MNGPASSKSPETPYSYINFWKWPKTHYGGMTKTCVHAHAHACMHMHTDVHARTNVHAHTLMNWSNLHNECWAISNSVYSCVEYRVILKRGAGRGPKILN